MAAIWYKCARCGKDRPGMRLPDERDADTISAWQALEERFFCSACEDLITGYVTGLEQGHR